MPPLLIEEVMATMDSGDESYHDLISTEMLETFLTEVSLTQTLIEKKSNIKYVIVLGK